MSIAARRWLVTSAPAAEQIAWVGSFGRRPGDVDGLTLFALAGEHGHRLGIHEVVLRLLDQRLQVDVASLATDH